MRSHAAGYAGADQAEAARRIAATIANTSERDCGENATRSLTTHCRIGSTHCVRCARRLNCASYPRWSRGRLRVPDAFNATLALAARGSAAGMIRLNI